MQAMAAPNMTRNLDFEQDLDIGSSGIVSNNFLREFVKMQRPVTQSEIPELCKLIAAGNKPDVVTFAMQLLVPVIQKTTMDWELGDVQNLVNLISVVEHLDLSSDARKLQATVVYEVIRQVTSEQKAITLLQRYGISKLLLAVKNHAHDHELKRLIEDLTQKLVEVGKNCLSVNVLFMLAQSGGVSDVHPKLSRTAWSALVQLSEKQINEKTNTRDIDQHNREGDFENFIPKFLQIVKQPLPRVDSQGSIEDLQQQKRQSLQILSNLALHEYLRPMIHAHEGI